MKTQKINALSFFILALVANILLHLPNICPSLSSKVLSFCLVGSLSLAAVFPLTRLFLLIVLCLLAASGKG